MAQLDLPDPSIVDEGNGIKVITEYKYNDEGKKVKVTRRVRLVTKKQKANHVVAERKKWEKFGSAKSSKPSFEEGITMLGEEVSLNLSSKTDFDAAEQPMTVSDKIKKMKMTITCRVCKGDHWTSKCPYKDKLAPLGETIDQITSGTAAPASESSSSLDGASAAVAEAAPKTGRYVPPSMRGKGSTSLADLKAHGSSRRDDDNNTLRVTNLSEDTREPDVYQLFSKFGRLSRVYVSLDRETQRCKGFAFVSFHERSHAEKALSVMNGYGFDSLILRVEWARRSE